MRIVIDFNDAETVFIREISAETGVSERQIMRALLWLSANDASLRAATCRAAKGGATIASDTAGRRKGLSEADYRAALDKGGSITRTARLLDVNRATVVEMIDRHGIAVKARQRQKGRKKRNARRDANPPGAFPHESGDRTFGDE